MAANQDAKLKKHVSNVLVNCGLEKAVIDREVQLNWDGETDSGGNLVPQKEIDVVVKFSYRGRRVFLFFECEDSSGSSGIKAYYQGYKTQVDAILATKASVKVVQSSDKTIEGRHFRDVDEIHVGFVFGSKLPQTKYISNKAEAEKHGFIVWNSSALEYYRRISSILRTWTRYELFKDFSLALEGAGTVEIPAIQLRQKGNTMFLANIHPGLLLKIGYVVRRATAGVRTVVHESS